ncbi:metal-sulfur cluster assembly factor [Paraburkholderia sacchari]|uniref:metal-sulfur cluster assembly factor n=1 Tax=Paraburkholderia sacchari TaxID=159450 RepID=UPI003D97D0F0
MSALHENSAETAIRDALRQVIDPEVGVNIVDLGLVYRVELGPRCLLVEIAMTSPACPMGAFVREEVRAVAREVAPSSVPVDVALVWDPPWSPAMMSEAAREVLHWPEH